MKKTAGILMVAITFTILTACGKVKETATQENAVTQENTVSSESIYEEATESETGSDEESTEQESKPVSTEYWDGSKKLMVDDSIPFAEVQPYGDKLYSSLEYEIGTFDELPIFQEIPNDTGFRSQMHYQDDVLWFCIQDNILYYVEDDGTQPPKDWLRARLYARPMEGTEADTILLAEDVSDEIAPVYQNGVISYSVYTRGETDSSSANTIVRQISAKTGEIIHETGLFGSCWILGISNAEIYYEDRSKCTVYKYIIQEDQKVAILEDSTRWIFYYDRGNLLALDTTKEEINQYQITQVLERGEKINRIFPCVIEPDDSYRDIRYSDRKVSYRKGREFYVYDLETNEERSVAKLDTNGTDGKIVYIGEEYLYMEEFYDVMPDIFFYKVDKNGKKTLITSWINYE